MAPHHMKVHDFLRHLFISESHLLMGLTCLASSIVDDTSAFVETSRVGLAIDIVFLFVA